MNDTRRIKGVKTFTAEVTTNNLDLTTLDDAPVSDLVTTLGPNAVVGPVDLPFLVAHELSLPEGGTVGGVDLSERAVLLDGDVRLGMLIFKGFLFLSFFREGVCD